MSTNLPSYQFMISIHALREEGDSYQQGLSRMWTNFYPRPPRGGRPAQSSVFESSQEQFLSTPSARRATSAFNGSNNHIRFLSTPSARRATDELPLLDRSPSDFYPRPPRGGRLHHGQGQELGKQFLSTPSARRATLCQHYFRRVCTISIHALREEGDFSSFAMMLHIRAFLSTPSARRATARTESMTRTALIIFLSTPSARRATSAEAAAERAFQKISIHALREEGDNELADNLISLMQFLSTPSARRATGSLNSSLHAFFPFLSTPSARRATLERRFLRKKIWKISIHALREEGDRVVKLVSPRLFSISIHALREEGDKWRQIMHDPLIKFLSTPSARRATRA